MSIEGAGGGDPDDANPCTIDSCDPSTGLPVHVPAPGGTRCDDGNVCNGLAVCDGAGACVAGVPRVVDDGNPCTDDACDPGAGPTHTPVVDGTSCADDDVCNGAESCIGGHCTGGAPPAVDDGDACTVDACDPALGVTHVAAADGTSCADGNACNGAESCVAGACQPGAAPASDDANPCTLDACEPATGVTHTAVADGTGCADGDACNGAESCQAGLCAAGVPLVVDDGNACTVDACDPALGVTHVAAADGTSCADGDACNGAESCVAGACLPGTPPASDDGNPCTLDACDPATGVTHTPVADGTGCADGDACNGAETCLAGVCVAGVSLVVDDGNVCTTDTCDPLLGARHNPVAAGGPCEDGNPCNGSESCDGAGSCAAGTPLAVDDDNTCTTDVCDPVEGVRHLPAVGASCSDGNACNGVETCGSEGTCVAGLPLEVDDGDRCTADVCDPVLGISHTVTPGCALPEPADIAPPVDATVSTTMFAGTRFLYEGGSPIQTGVAPGAIAETRAAIIGGQVRTREGAALPDVRITVLDRPELGATLTRANGRFDLVVNGGSSVTLRFERTGYFAAQRWVDVNWQTGTEVPEVIRRA